MTELGYIQTTYLERRSANIAMATGSIVEFVNRRRALESRFSPGNAIPGPAPITTYDLTAR